MFRCGKTLVRHGMLREAWYSSAAFREATIFAPATGKGKSAISILRISGPQAALVYHRMTLPPISRVRKAVGAKLKEEHGLSERKAMLRRIVHPATGEVLDEAIVIYFPPNSALTAQPTLELHTHGSPALTALLLQLLPTLGDDFRIAEPGEFTRLAFEAGKLDLTEVEGIRDLVEADTEAQRKLAARQAGGQMRIKYEEMRSSIIEATSLVEALIDFGEDEAISEIVFDQANEKVSDLRDLIGSYLNDGRRGEIIREGIQLAIIGAPNAGKSSLLNWLGQREAAIVAPTPGTTRDVIQLSINFHGYPILVADTAGLRSTSDHVESIGVERAKKQAECADITLCVLSLPSLFPTPHTVTIDPLTLSLIDSNTLIILNKTDSLSLTPTQRQLILDALRLAGKDWIGKERGMMWEISLREGRGLERLVEGLKGVLKERFDLMGESEDTVIVTSARHRRHLEECQTSLTAFLRTCFLPSPTAPKSKSDDTMNERTEMDPEEIVLAAEELRYAILALGKITGAVDVEEVLGEIFRGFCVGK